MARPADPDDYGSMLTLADAAQILGVHVDTARRYAKDEIIPAHRLPNSRQYYIMKDELIDFIRAQPSNPAPDARPVAAPAGPGTDGAV